MTRPRQLAAVSAKLIALLVFVGLIGGAYWGCRVYRSEPAADTGRIFRLYCTECDKIHEFSFEEARGRPRQDGKVLCPICNTYSATWGVPMESGDMVAP